jgi:hypothetical protein
VTTALAKRQFLLCISNGILRSSTHFVILIQSRVELEADGERSNDFKLVLLDGLVVDDVLTEDGHIFADQDWQLDLLLDVV